MAGRAARGSPVSGDDQSLGDLVSQATKDVSQLIRYELDLAKMELRDDARRLGVGGALFGTAGFVGCLVLVMLCFAYATGLIAAGIWAWAAFLIVAGTLALLAGLAVVIGRAIMLRMTGLNKTRQTVQEDLALIRRENGAPAPPAIGAG
jgi:ABC-type multidrug transport system fused ATPase/permease subunit